MIRLRLWNERAEVELNRSDSTQSWNEAEDHRRRHTVHVPMANLHLLRLWLASVGIQLWISFSLISILLRFDFDSTSVRPWNGRTEVQLKSGRWSNEKTNSRRTCASTRWNPIQILIKYWLWFASSWLPNRSELNRIRNNSTQSEPKLKRSRRSPKANRRWNEAELEMKTNGTRT